MSIPENKYHSTIKLEFKELVSNIVYSGRTVFHAYTIHRLLSLGLLIDFTFQYVQTDNPGNYVCMELDLKEFGKVYFVVDIQTNYGNLAQEGDVEVLKDFLNNYDTCIEAKPKRRKFFDK